MMRYDAEGLEQLLESWRAGRAERGDLYFAVRSAMYQAARQGIGTITAANPDEQDVEDAVYQAFCELEAKNPIQVKSLVGLASRIAYRRGQDAGRQCIRHREQMRGAVADPAFIAGVEFSGDDVRVAAAREVLAGYAMECLETLPEDQRAVVAATIMERESISDWAMLAGKTHQAAGRQRTRAVNSLRRCVESKRDAQHSMEGEK